MPAGIVPVFERFVRGPTIVREALDGVGPAIISRPGPEGWSIRDVVVHLADTELVRGVRLRRLIAEDDPSIEAIDEKLWKRRLHYLWRSPDASLALFELLRFANAEILRECDAATWQRSGMHSEDGRITVVDLVLRGAGHAEDHARQVLELRNR
jgi:hypothetical protein